MSGEFDLQSAFQRVHDRLDDIQENTIRNTTKLEALVGNGQPGKIRLLESDIEELKEWKATAKGWMGSLTLAGAMLTGGIHLLIDYFKGRH